MHQNRFQLELRPRLCCSSSERSLKAHSWNKGDLLLEEEGG